MTANLLLMSNTAPLEGFIKGNSDMTRSTFSDEIQLLGTGRARRHGLMEAQNPDQQSYKCCQGDQPIYGLAVPRFSRRCWLLRIRMPVNRFHRSGNNSHSNSCCRRSHLNVFR